MKQVIVIRKDLGMRAGKMIAQGGHAVHLVCLNHSNDDRYKEWIKNSFTKITVRVESEEEFINIRDKAREVGLICEEIIDSGKTEFNGVPTRTALAIGPDTNENLFPITGHLKLL